MTHPARRLLEQVFPEENASGIDGYMATIRRQAYEDCGIPGGADPVPDSVVARAAVEAVFDLRCMIDPSFKVPRRWDYGRRR